MQQQQQQKKPGRRNDTLDNLKMYTVIIADEKSEINCVGYTAARPRLLASYSIYYWIGNL